MGVSKNMKESSALVDKTIAYSLTDAAGLMKSISKAKFDASVDIAVKLGVDPKLANQMVRGVVTLQHGTGKDVKVLALVTADKEAEAKETKVMPEELNMSFVPVPVMKDQQRASGRSASEVDPDMISKPLEKNRKEEGIIWPVEGRLLSGFGPKSGGLYNDGINIRVKEGVHVKASASGRVVYADDDLEGYGNLVIIKHSNGYITAYAHNRELLVKQGDFVEQGEDIAVAGSTGNVRVSQLHFGIRKGKKPVNPVRYLKTTRS